MAARIPVYTRQVAADDRQQIARVSGNDPVGQALQGIGQTAMQGGMRLIDQQIEQQRKEQQDLAAVQVSNVLSQGEVYWQEQATNRQQAWKPGEDLRPKLGEDFDKWVEQSKEGLGTPEAQKYFLQHAARMRAGLLTNAFSFQRKALTDTINAQSAQAENADEILVSQQWRDPKAVDAIIARRVEPLLARSDLTEAQKITESTRYKQRMLLARERAYVENDPAGWLRENGGRTQAAAAAGGVTMSAVWSALIQQESGGKQSAVSPKGAIGVAQVMPATGPEAAALAGLAWDEKRFRTDRAYNEALGRAYFNKQLADFGDVPKALAAYNGGPGRLREAIDKAGPGGDWLALMPRETRDYVKAITAKASGSPPAEAAPGTLSTDTLSRTAAMLDPDKVYALRTAAESRMAQLQSQYRAEGQRLVTDLMAAHKDGKVEQQQLQPDYFDRAFGPEGARIYSEYQQSRAMGQDVAAFKTMAPAEIEAAIKAGDPKPGTGYASADARQNVRRQAAATVLEARAKDPQAFAMTNGLSRTKPLDMAQPDTMIGELSNRASVASVMRDRYGAPYRILTNPEAQQLGQVLQSFPTAGKLSYLEKMRLGLPDPTAFRAAMQQIAPDSPVTAVAASILTAQDNARVSGGMFSADTALIPRKVAETMLEGEAVLNPTKASQKQDGRGGKFPMPKEKDLELAFQDKVGTAFRNDPGGMAVAYQAFKAYYAGAASQRGVLSEAIDNKLAREALEAATGGVIDFNGAGHVLKPWGMSDDNFKGEITRQFNAAMQATGYKGTSLDNLRGYGLLGLGQGRYAVVNGPDALRAPDGQPVILTLTPRSVVKIPGAQ